MEKSAHFINSLGFQLEITAKIFRMLSENCFNREVKNRITLEEYTVLDSLVCYPHIDAKTLAATLMRETMAVNKILSNLLKKKLIKEIKPNGKDIQVSYYQLTKDGIRVYQDIMPGNDIMVGVLAQFINESELISFTKSLLKVRNILISLSDAEYKK